MREKDPNARPRFSHLLLCRESRFEPVSLFLLVVLLRHIKYGTDLLSPLSCQNTEISVQLKIVEDLLQLAHFLRLRDVQERLIRHHMIPNLNKDNAVKYAMLAVTHLRIHSFKF